MAGILGGTPLSTPFYGNSRAFNTAYNADPVGTTKRIAEEQAREAATRKAIVDNAVKIGHDNGVESDPVPSVDDHIAVARELEGAKTYDTQSDLYKNKGSENASHGLLGTLNGVKDSATRWLGNEHNILGHTVTNAQGLAAGAGAAALVAGGVTVGAGLSGRGALRGLALTSRNKRTAARGYLKDAMKARALADEYDVEGRLSKADRYRAKVNKLSNKAEEMIRKADAIDRRKIDELKAQLTNPLLSDVKRYKLQKKLDELELALRHSNG